MSTSFTPNVGAKLRILVSVTNKQGLDKLKRLTDYGAELVSTGGTATALTGHGIPCTDVQDVTHFPEMMDGRVKILHPAIFAGLLADQSKQEHLDAIALHRIAPFHGAIINLYDFAGNPKIANIDVGGPSGVRAAAKNGLIVIVDPNDYDRVMDAMMENKDGSIPQALRLELVVKAFEHTAEYDRMIAGWLQRCVQDGIDPFATSATH